MKRRPRLLVLSPAAPWPPTTGGYVRIAELSERLASRFEITFVAPMHRGTVLPTETQMRLRCPPQRPPGLARRAMALLDVHRPYHTALVRHPDVAKLVSGELAAGAYDAVYSHFIHPLLWLPHAPARVIVDQQNVDRLYWANKAEICRPPVRWVCRWNQRRTISFEQAMLPRLWAYVSVSDEDRERTVAYAGATVKNFWVAPNGVDTARFRPRPPGRSSDGKIVLGYLGSLDLSMNADAVRWFCARLLPRIRARLADVDVEFIGIGRNPTHRLRRLASRERGISFSGTVPDVVPWLQSVDILVCPIRMGAGTKLKVAEAMACGLPVIGSPPALAGAPGQDREHFFRAEDDDAFVEAACDLAASPQRRLAVGQAARQMAEERLSWGRIADNLADDIANALSRDGWRA